ncbi:MAG: hypothetical protein OXE74_02455 [Cyanobacteria bacterium MAG CAR2_bin_4]|nr:hypothetical protein [Cyanobacteria bacterium MAG CAR2_bin_4]
MANDAMAMGAQGGCSCLAVVKFSEILFLLLLSQSLIVLMCTLIWVLWLLFSLWS